MLAQPLVWDDEIIQRYDLSGPRYTSYPTAPQFNEGFTDAQLAAAVERSNRSQRPLSLYVHLPFCESLCFYCGCHKVVTHTRDRVMPYLERVEQEMRLQAAAFDHTRPVQQLHWGGGTPTYLNDAEMSWLMAATRRYFTLLDDDTGEYALEIHPGQVTPKTMAHLRRLGFNRISMGIQDFDPQVQAAVNRYNRLDDVTELVTAVRDQGYHSISMDLIYGLPLQSRDSVMRTLDQVIALSPDRLSLFNYAHLPHLFKSQRLIREEDLPGAREKLAILHGAIDHLQSAGYVYIGMDHFAKPSDSLVIAQQAGKLQRNFQGYATHAECDLLSFGVSSISAFGDIYVQNAKKMDHYQALVDGGHWRVVKGIELSAEDRLRRHVINQLICHFYLDFAALRTAFQIQPELHFANELAQLAPMVEDGLLEINRDGIQVSNSGRLLIRRVCMVFDQYLHAGSQIRYSKVI